MAPPPPSPPAVAAAAAIFVISVVLFSRGAVADAAATRVCVVGGGIGGSSVAHFLKQLTCEADPSAVPCLNDVRIIERSGKVGGRMATVTIGGDTFEAGASIIHPKNLHALRFASLLGLRHRSDPQDDDSWLGIWGGSDFVFTTLAPPAGNSPWILRKLYSLLNSLRLLWRYGFSLMKMNGFTNEMLEKFMKFYEWPESRPVFSTVEEMLQWSGLYGLTQRTLEEELIDAGVSPLLIMELITVVTRVNYGQDVHISGLAGAVSLAGSNDGLWSIDGGNWQIAAGLIERSNATLLLHEEINSVTFAESQYLLASESGASYHCDVVVIATPLDELNISFTPPVSIPRRRLQHTFTTFVRGALNPKYFGLESASEIPALIGTLEEPHIPFSSISILKRYGEDDMAYKIFSRKPAEDDLLDQLFIKRKETIRIDWPAYPHFEAPEVFAPIILDGQHLYYINAFESAASAIETGAVAAENVARLIVSRLAAGVELPRDSLINKTPASGQDVRKSEL